MPADSSFASVDHYLGATGQNLLPTGGISTFTKSWDMTVGGTGGANIIGTGFTPGYRFAILAIAGIVTTPSTGSGGTQVITCEISTVATTGGVLTTTLAGTATAGVVVNGTAVTDLNIGSATDTLQIVVLTGGTVYTAGVMDLVITIQNLDA